MEIFILAYRRIMGLIENYTELLNKTFTCIDDVPEFPGNLTPEEYNKLIELYYRAGAIPKSKLKPGGWYLGQCRNTNVAQWWPKDGFCYIRYKLGGAFVDTINHFEDDDGYDLFIPIKLLYCENDNLP